MRSSPGPDYILLLITSLINLKFALKGQEEKLCAFAFDMSTLSVEIESIEYCIIKIYWP